MNQGKLEVVKQMARVNINILGISELKWTGMGEFNSYDHYIYYCGRIAKPLRLLGLNPPSRVLLLEELVILMLVVGLTMASMLLLAQPFPNSPLPPSAGAARSGTSPANCPRFANEPEDTECRHSLPGASPWKGLSGGF